MTTTIRRIAAPPTETAQVVRLVDETQYRVWSDGSWRRDPIKVRGKARVKAAKRIRHNGKAGL